MAIVWHKLTNMRIFIALYSVNYLHPSRCCTFSNFDCKENSLFAQYREFHFRSAGYSIELSFMMRKDVYDGHCGPSSG